MDEARAKAIFLDAIELPKSERPAFLARACAGDQALESRVITLLDAADTQDQFLASATVSPPPPASAGRLDEGVGSRVGPYLLKQLLGEGGFGQVYRAEQLQPIRRIVALKIIKLGMDTRAVAARLEQERQALAAMDHPGIAKVFDAGTTDSGRPYFVMELVEGEPITGYCDRHALTIRDRLGLIAQVCRAVQHAHTKGIIHRDIKPSNVLVGEQDGKPHARVIDFGIAKAMDQGAAAQSIFTQVGQLVGTPAYMSPEQAGGAADIDTRTDVYSLGVLLYEVLIGATPFDPRTLRRAAYAELQRIIREVDPPTPSTRLVQEPDALPSVAAARRTEPARLGQTIRGEIDWIVMKALEKDRARRYETATGLAADIERFLAGEAIDAAPPSRAYRARKFLRRHRAAFASSLAILLALVLGLVATAYALVRASRERDRAVKAEVVAQERAEEAGRARAQAERFNRVAVAVSDFFTLDILDVKPLPPGVPEPTVSELLARVPQKIEKYFKSEPMAEGIIRERVGQIYLNMGKPALAQPYLESAVPLLEASLGPEQPRTISASRRLASLYESLEQFDRAESIYDRVHRVRLKERGEQNLFTWSSLADRGRTRVRMGRTADGIADYDLAIEKLATIPGASRAWFLCMIARARSHVDLGDLYRAEGLAREGLELARSSKLQLVGIEQGFQACLGSALLAQGRALEAFTELDAAYLVHSKLVGPTELELVALRIDRALALSALARHAEAIPELQECYNLASEGQGERAPWPRRIAGHIAKAYENAGDPAAAQAWRARQ